jgi:hypothetical protein
MNFNFYIKHMFSISAFVQKSIYIELNKMLIIIFDDLFN